MKRKFGYTHAQREDDMKAQGEDGHVQAKERGADHFLPSWPSEESNPADLDLRLPASGSMSK